MRIPNKDSEYKQQQNLHAAACTEQSVNHYQVPFCCQHILLQVKFADIVYENKYRSESFKLIKGAGLLHVYSLVFNKSI